MTTTRILQPSELDVAASWLRAGKLVAIPTETVYGLAARGLDEPCVRAIYTAKGRPQDNPVILHVPSLADALPLWALDDVTHARVQALATLWPGPLTIVAHKSALVPDVVTAGLSKVAVRVPDHALTVQLLRLVGEPLAAPSANASGRPSPTSVRDVLESLDGRINAVLDGGPCTHGIESTVVDVTGPVPRVLRPGALSLAQLRAVLPDVEPRASGMAAHVDDASPGLRHRHYAPRVERVQLVDDVTDLWADSDGLLVRASTRARLGPRAAPLEVLPDDATGYAHGLYAALYRLERAEPGVVTIEDVPHDDVNSTWVAVRDRLLRAVG